MVNGPMGGNMGTPPVAPQPPQVSFTTTAESRGGFNNFLKSIPATTSMTPLPPMGSSPTMPMANPMGNPMGNIDIFNQPPSMGMMGMNQPQMNPMMQPPMQQPNIGLQAPMMNQQPMMMADGGGVPPRRTEIMGQDHMLSYITPEEGGILKALGGAGRPGPMGIPSFFDAGDFDGGGFDGSSYSDNNDDNNFSFSDDTVGDTSAGDFTVGDTEDRSQSDNFQSGLDNISLGSDDQAFEDDSAFTGVNVGLENTGNFTTGVLPGSRDERFARFYNNDYAQRGIGRDFQTKVNRNVLNEAGDNALTYGDYFEKFTPSSENPGGTGNRMADFTKATGKGPNDMLSINDMPNIMDIQGKYEAGIRGVEPGQIQKIASTVNMNNDRDIANILLSDLDLSKTAPDVTPDPMGTDRSPGRMNAVFGPQIASTFGGLTPNEVMNISGITSPGQTGEIPVKDNGFINRQLSSLVNKTLGRDEFVNPEDRTTDIFSPSASDFANFQSTRDQLPNVDEEYPGDALPGKAYTTQNVSPQNTADRIARNNRSINEIRADIGSRVPDTALETMANRQDIFQPDNIGTGQQPVDTALENMTGRRDAFTNYDSQPGYGPTDVVYDIDTRDTRNFVGDDFAPALDIVDARQKALNPIEFSDTDSRLNPIEFSDTDNTVSTLTRPEDYEENVGRAFNANRMADIERLYNLNVGQRGTGVGDALNTSSSKGTDPTFFEGLGVPGIATTIGDFIERTSRENMANEIALGRPMGLGETLFGFNANPAKNMEEYMTNTQTNVLNEAGDSETVSRRIPESQLVRNDSGRVIGIRDASGRLVSGYDPDAPVDTGDNGDSNQLILRRIAKEKEEEKEDKTPNVFGGGTTATPTEKGSVVVDSPFTSNVGDYSPTGFDSGDLNALIARLLKTSNPKKAAQGGVIGYANGGGVDQALDRFLASA